MRRFEWGVKELKRRGRLLETVVGGRGGWRLKTTGRWGPSVGEGRERVRYRFGNWLDGLRAGFLLWAEVCPRGPNRFLFLLSSFSFSGNSDLSFEKGSFIQI
jgi:hypothetical protein